MLTNVYLRYLKKVVSYMIGDEYHSLVRDSLIKETLTKAFSYF